VDRVGRPTSPTGGGLTQVIHLSGRWVHGRHVAPPSGPLQVRSVRLCARQVNRWLRAAKATGPGLPMIMRLAVRCRHARAPLIRGLGMAEKPIIAVVTDDSVQLGHLVEDLRRRFEPDFRVLGVSSETVAEQLLVTSCSVAAVVVAPDLNSGSGVAMLSMIRRTHSAARRILLVERGRWRAHPIRRAMVLGEVDGYLFVPWQPREQWLYLPMSEYLAAWSRTQTPEIRAVTIVGPRWHNRSHELRDMFSRASIPFAFHEPDTEDGAAALARMGLDGSALPAVALFGEQGLGNPTDLQVIGLLGFRTDLTDLECDVAIVGAGPAGLSAAVYGASEGLRTIVIDAGLPGGQAGTSSSIRNYLGYPRGVSGAELANLAVEQSWLFGAEFLLAQEIVDLRVDSHVWHLLTAGGDLVKSRAVVIATGVTWRRLRVPRVEEFLGAGVFYGAAGSEADALRGEQVFVVGGGNSAGQAALHLARRGAKVSLLVRGDSLTSSMSDYLINELQATEGVWVRPHTEVVDGGGEGRLERLVLKDRHTGDTATVPAAALFVMIGAVPRTDWLATTLARDPAGYLLTGTDVADESRWLLERQPYFLETSAPGVFAVGDVRHGATRRVAPSVGSGAIAIQLIHEFLASQSDVDHHAGQ
jgi:thioredoxin reductase (NADPH)